MKDVVRWPDRFVLALSHGVPVLTYVLCPELKVRQERTLLFVDELRADARPPIELIFKICTVHFMDT